VTPLADENDKNEELENDTVADAGIDPVAAAGLAGEEETVLDAMMGPRPGDSSGYNIDAMLNVGLNVQIILGQTRMAISELLKLSRGSVIELNKRIGEPVDIVINDRTVARGDLVKLDEDRVGVSLIEIVKDYVSEKK
jgi:flagellar motor switch protein FliN/FliY